MVRRILLFDDEQSSLGKVYVHLLGEGFEVEATIDPEEIVPRTVRLHPDVVLLNSDVLGFNGSEVCATIKRRYKVPIILMLNKDSSASIKIDSCAADEVIYKPIDLKNLNKVLQQLIATNQ